MLFCSEALLCLRAWNAMTFPLWTGATCVLDAGRPTPDSTFANIERFQPSLYFGFLRFMPHSFRLWKARSGFFFPPSVHFSGRSTSSGYFQAMERKTGTVILDGIGSTELLHIFISNRPDDLKPGTSGKLVRGMREDR